MAYRLVSLLLRKKSTLMKPPSHGRLHFSTASTFERVANTVKNDPFVKLSLSLCALIVGGTLVMELYNRLKKNSSPTVLMLPPRFAHYSVKRESLLTDLRNKVRKHSSKQTPPILYVIGPPGSGKTELIWQFCEEYGPRKWLGLKSVPAVVVCLDATSPEALQLSLSEAANRLGLQPASSTQAAFSAVLSWLASNRLPWLLVIDHLTENTQSCLKDVLTKCVPECVSSKSAGAVVITTSLPMPSSPHNQLALQVSQRFVHCLHVEEGRGGQEFDAQCMVSSTVVLNPF